MTIKRRTASLSVILLTVLLVLAVLIACDPNAGNVDKASQNQEFVSFRKKVVKILKDNGIFVNDLDSKTTAAAVDNGGKMYATADSLYANGSASDNIADVGAIMTKKEYLAEDTTGYDFALKQVYSLALKLSLCVGDGLLNYFDESNFYDVPVYIPDVNLVVTSKDNEISIYTYQQTIDNNSSNGSLEFFNKINIVFNSDDNYYFTVVETGGDWISSGSTNDTYFYGDSNKQFLMFGSNGEVFYTPNATDFYTTFEQQTVADVSKALGDGLFDINVDEYRKIKDNVRHTFTQKQFEELSDKYFKDVQSSVAPQESEFVYEDLGGKNVLTYYRAAEGETSVTIPSSVKYISDQFSIEDMQGSVTSLTIPASVTEIVDSDGKTVTDVNYVRFGLRRQEGEALFQNITVEQGSPLFKSGSGHLRLKNGAVVYALDKSGGVFDLDVIMCALRQSGEGFQYNNLFKITVKSVNIDSSEISRVAHTYGQDEYFVIEQLQKILNASSVAEYNFTVSLPDVEYLEDKPSDGGRFNALSFAIDLKSDVTINVKFAQCGRNDNLYLGVALKNGSSAKRNVTVNVTGFSYHTSLNVGPEQPTVDKGEEMPDYVSNSAVYTVFDLDVSKFYFDGFCQNNLERDKQNSQVNFDASAEEQHRYFEVAFAIVSGEGEHFCILNVTDDVRDGDEIIIPDELFGIKVREINIDVNAVAGKKVTVALPDLNTGFGSVNFYNSADEQSVKLNNTDFVISCEGGLELLKSRITNYDSDTNYSITFTLQSDGETELFQTGWEFGSGNPDNEVKVFYLYDNENSYEMRNVEYSVRNGAVVLESADLKTAYFAYPQACNNDDPDGLYAQLPLFVDEQGRLCAEVSKIIECETYILVTRPIGVQNIPLEWQLAGKGGEVEVTIESEVKDGKTYFQAFIGEFTPSFNNEEIEHDGVIYDFESVLNAEFFDWMEISCKVTEREFDPDSWEVTSEHEYRGGRKFLLVLRNENIRVKLKDSYIVMDITANVDGNVFKQEVTVGEEYQIIFIVDEWNLQNVDKYKYFAVYSMDGGEVWRDIAFEQIDGHLCAITNGRPPLDFTLKRVELGRREYKMQGDNYDLTLTLDIVKPTWADGYPEIMYMDFTKSTATIDGTVEGRKVYGQGSLPYTPELRYLDVEYGVCHYKLVSTDGGVGFELLDEYVTINVTVNGNTEEKRIVKGQSWAIDVSDLVTTVDEYCYFYLIDGKLGYNVYLIDNRIDFHYGENDTYTDFVLCRMAKGNTSFDLQSDDAELSYDLHITFMVDFDESYEPRLCLKNITAEGTVNGTQIASSESHDFLSVSYKLEGLPYSYTLYFTTHVDGLEYTIQGVYKK